MPTTLEAHGIRFTLPDPWSGRIFRPVSDDPREKPGPVAHAASFAIPIDDAGYASTMMGMLGPLDIGCVLIEMIPDAVIRPGQGLYASSLRPGRLGLEHFSPNTLHVRRQGQVGVQWFFTVRNRPMIFYAVMGSPKAAVGAGAADTARANPPSALDALNTIVTTLQLASAPQATDFAALSG